MRRAQRTGPTGWVRPLTMVLRSSPAAVAFTSIPGSSGGSNRASGRTTPWMFMQWRILNRRSATVSQYPSRFSLRGTQLGRSHVERKLGLQLHQRISHWVEAGGPELRKGLGSHDPARRNLLRPRAQNVGSEDIEQRGLVDGFDGVLLEEVVAPRDQVVEIFHDDAI